MLKLSGSTLPIQLFGRRNPRRTTEKENKVAELLHGNKPLDILYRLISVVCDDPTIALSILNRIAPPRPLYGM